VAKFGQCLTSLTGVTQNALTISCGFGVQKQRRQALNLLCKLPTA